MPGGPALVPAVEGGARLALGVIRDPRSLDEHGWTARLELERALEEPSPSEPDLQIAWEELARSRTPRFAAGQRVVVALVPLPPGSLWRQRFPNGGALLVGGGGQAFLRDPDARTLGLLERWARVGALEREGRVGVAALASLWAEAAPAVAVGALARLAEIPGLGGKVEGEGEAAATFRTGLSDRSRPLELRAGLVRLAGERRIAALLPALESLDRRGGPLEAEAIGALASFSDGLPQDRVRALLARPEPAIRAVGARSARGPLLGTVGRLVKRDPAPEVRTAAAVALLDQQGMSGFDVAAQALFDADLGVRARTATRIGELGAAAVPGLVALVNTRWASGAEGPIGALILAGNAGRAAVQAIAESHPDPKVRGVARLALGDLGPEH